MNIQILKTLILTLLAIASVVLADSQKKMTCTLTGKKVTACCCEELKNGKMFCKLAKKEIAECCCTGM